MGNILEDADVESNRLVVAQGKSFLNIADTASTLVKSGAGYLHAIIVNNSPAGSLTVYDNTAGSGTKIATLKASITEGTYTFNCQFDNGLYVIPAAVGDYTIVYR